jgi:DNA-directed RNA polymerase II subunit RPB2
MTIAHLLECVLAKSSVLNGELMDATPFNNYGYDEVFERLETKFGMNRYGNEIMYNGRTGEQIHTEIFIGPTYYQRLKHMVADKINYRLNGPVNVTTRQPTKGRGNNGGLRIGEMERDSILAHGITGFLKESLLERSDKYSFSIENSIGNIAVLNKKTFKPFKDDSTFFSTIETPYAFKLFLQELQALGVKPYLSTSPIEDIDNYDDNEVLDDSSSDDE